MPQENLTAKLEALLFIYGEPMTYKKIVKMLEIAEKDVKELVSNLKDALNQDSRGLSLVLDAEKAQLVTKPGFGNMLQKIVKEEVSETLTPASLETLSIITYTGPISRAEIEYIRGVNSTFILRNLLIRGLIERSVDPKKSNVYLYNPSLDFLKFIGISKVEDLPEYQKFNDLIKKLREPKPDDKEQSA